MKAHEVVSMIGLLVFVAGIVGWIFINNTFTFGIPIGLVFMFAGSDSEMDRYHSRGG